MKQKQIFMIFEKKETWLESIVSDIVSFSLAFLLIFISAYLNQTLWTIAALVLFSFCLTHMACSSKWTTLKNKQEAVAWAISLNDEADNES